MNSLDKQYKELLQTILEHGVEKEDRTGTGTRSIFGYTIRHNMQEGFPAITTKKLAFKTMTTELLWFLKGDTNIKYLVDNNCHIWDGDAYKAYLNRYDSKDGAGLFTKEEFIQCIKDRDKPHPVIGELGPIYGKQWRDWTNYQYEYGNVVSNNSIDQISNLINDLKTNPDSRRLMVNAWHVSEIPAMTLPPCHYGFQVYTRPTTREEKIVNPGKYRAISLMFNMRSNDVPLGLPFNLASYGLLLEIFAKMVNMVPDELIANLGDAHIYKNQVDGVKEQLTREPYNLPKLDIHPGILDYELDKLEVDMFKLISYQSHPSIKMPLSN